MRRAVIAVAGVLAAALVTRAAPPETFRYSRPIEAAPGWARLALPDDVLDACRPGLPDLRIVDGTGREIPYALEQDITGAFRRFPVENLESIEKTETTGLIDRGPSPGFADAVTFEISGVDFLKPVRVQSSENRAAWSDVARGSIFATGGLKMVTLRLPQTDRRYLRFRLDDRNGAPLRPEAVVVHAQTAAAAEPARGRPVEIRGLDSKSDSTSRYSGVLPAANLDATALRFQAQDPAFARRVRVYERVFFRDEVFRRLVAEGTISRTPGTESPLDLCLSEIGGRNLEIEIENGDSPPLGGLHVEALSKSRSIRFFVASSESLTLLYGSGDARAPVYDVAKASRGGVPREVPAASLGAAVVRATVSSVTAPERVALPDPTKWKDRRTIELPKAAGLAYLDLEDPLRGLSDLRIVDQQNRQVPFLVEQGSHEHRRKVRPTVVLKGSTTLVSLGEPEDLPAADAIELEASGPEYFSRQVAVHQEERDARGVVARRILGSARWERRPGERPPILRIAIERPRPAAGPLLAAIENGDNAPITIADAWILTSSVRLDFVFAAGDRLFLLSGNPEASPPSYDFAMLAGVILSSPADPVRLGPATAAPEASPPRIAGWFWGVVAAAVVALVYQLSRTLKKAP